MRMLSSSLLVGFAGFFSVVAGRHIFKVIALRGDSHLYTSIKFFVLATFTYFTYLPQYY